MLYTCKNIQTNRFLPHLFRIKAQRIMRIIIGLWLFNTASVFGFITYKNSPCCYSHNLPIKPIRVLITKASPSNDDSELESQRLKAKAEELRQQIRKLEEQLNSQRKSIQRNNDNTVRGTTDTMNITPSIPRRSLKNKRILVVGANGRLGSMVVRYLLRNYPELKEVVAAVHYVGTASTRGYGRLSYEVGAEDGVGTIGPIWSADDREASFMYSNDMKSYNLQKLVSVYCIWKLNEITKRILVHVVNMNPSWFLLLYSVLYRRNY